MIWFFPNYLPVLITQGALLDWYAGVNTSTINPYQYRATCQGPYCYTGECPDSLTLLNVGQNNWPIWSKVVIAGLIVGLSIISLFMKVHCLEVDKQ